jgi:hypothetical protein
MALRVGDRWHVNSERGRVTVLRIPGPSYHPPGEPERSGAAVAAIAEFKSSRVLGFAVPDRTLTAAGSPG